jgi:hypothetical protein
MRLFGLYLLTEAELMELEGKWFVLLPNLRDKNGGLIGHEGPGKWKWYPVPELKPADPRQSSNQPRGKKKRGKVVSQHHASRKTRETGARG